MTRQLEDDILFPLTPANDMAFSELLDERRRTPSGRDVYYPIVTPKLRWTLAPIAGRVEDATSPAFPPIFPRDPEEI